MTIAGNDERRQVSFKISSRTARMLGRQNVSNQHVAIIELIKNAYDADASCVDVRFTKADTDYGTIIIEDDGSGMTTEDLETRWLTIGTDFKEREPISPNGRVRTGAKGIGRFALDRLGGVGVMDTFRKRDGDGLQLHIDWKKYDDPTTSFESVQHDLGDIPNLAQSRGTRITISELRDLWHSDDFSALYNDLVFLVPPIQSGPSDFSIRLHIDTQPDLSGPVEPLVRAAAEYELQSTLDLPGRVRHVLRHRSGVEVVRDAEWSTVQPQDDTQLRLFDLEPACGPLESTILFYLRVAGDGSTLDYTLTDLRRYLNTFRGIRLYRDGFQIKPYGSKGDDWLGLDGRKQRSPEGVGQQIGQYRVSNNQLIGTIRVSRLENKGLEDRTSREGLVDNAAFRDLKSFVMDGLRFLEVQRQLAEKPALDSTKSAPLQESIAAVKTAVKRIKRAREAEEQPLPPSTTAFDDTVIQQDHSRDVVPQEDYDRLIEDSERLQTAAESTLHEVQLLRALATIGIALATFAHEIKGSIDNVLEEHGLLAEILNHLPDDIRDEATESLGAAKTSAERIEHWSVFVLERVRASRRTKQEIYLQDLVSGVVRAFDNSLRHRQITLDVIIDSDVPSVVGFPIDFEAIFINLISNAVKALEYIPLKNRRIMTAVRYDAPARRITIDFEDSGHGIRLQDLPNPDRGFAQVLEPFVLGKSSEGTGMGLSVVHRIIEDYHGVIDVEGQGTLGGARFTIKLPLPQVEVIG